MGTRADFYVGRNPETMEWLGSLAWDGYPSNIKKTGIFDSKSEAEFRANVVHGLKEEGDATFPDMGWPWPWDTSNTTDYAYAFDENEVWVCNYGHGWVLAQDSLPESAFENQQVQPFPEMQRTGDIPLANRRSGLTLVALSDLRPKD